MSNNGEINLIHIIFFFIFITRNECYQSINYYIKIYVNFSDNLNRILNLFRILAPVNIPIEKITVNLNIDSF
jgi:hypothetical protein